MSDQIPALILLVPFFAGMLVVITGLRSARFAWPISIAALSTSLWAAIDTAIKIAQNGPIEYEMGGWAAPMGIVYYIDGLNALVLILIAAVALLATIASREEITREFPSKVAPLYALILLFVTGVLGITLTGDAFNLYVLIEVAALTSYALLAQGNRRAAVSSFNYIILGSIGASFYLLGVGYLLIKTGSLNMGEIYLILRENELMDSTSIRIAFIMIMLGLLMKMALFPLHAWLPNAYSRCCHTASNLIAPLMTKVMIYVMARMIFTVFGIDYVLTQIPWQPFIVVLATLSIFAGSLMALGQTSTRRMLTYIIVAEVGYMVAGLWLLNTQSIQGALYHIIADGMMTVCLFISVHAVYERTRNENITAFSQLFTQMPLTMIPFVLAALSMMGIPPTCGFVSKWYLISGGIESGQWFYVVALITSSLINAILFFRIIENALFGNTPANGHAHNAHVVQRKNAPYSLLLPQWVSAFSLILLGLYNQPIIELLSSAMHGH